jgi:hypothetical protein
VEQAELGIENVTCVLKKKLEIEDFVEEWHMWYNMVLLV